MKLYKLTVRDILNFHPCEEYTKERIQELFKSVGCKRTVTFQKICEADIPAKDFLWLIIRPEFIPEKQLHEIALWCWDEIARPIWIKYYPNDNRPQEAVTIKKLWLTKKATNEELKVASCLVGQATKDAARGAFWDEQKGAACSAAWAAFAAIAAVQRAAWAVSDTLCAVSRDSGIGASDLAWNVIKSYIITEVINKTMEDK
jgi:hypothetical protein